MTIPKKKKSNRKAGASQSKTLIRADSPPNSKSKPSWAGFLGRWKNCTRCPLHAGRYSIVLGESSNESVQPVRVTDLLFIGEAPGEDEDALGFPFIGPSGKFLTLLLRSTLKVVPYTYYITNTVACIPWAEGRQGIRIPSPQEMTACRPRLSELINYLSPQGIVLLGRTAAENVTVENGLVPSKDFPLLKIPHPGSLIHLGKKGRDKSFQAMKSALISFAREITRDPDSICGLCGGSESVRKVQPRRGMCHNISWDPPVRWCADCCRRNTGTYKLCDPSQKLTGRK